MAAKIFYSYDAYGSRRRKNILQICMQPPKPVFRRADIRAPEESSGWIFRDITDESGRISLPIGRNREESGDGRSGRPGPRPPPLSSLFQPMGREMRPLSSMTSRKIHSEDSSGARISGGYPADIRPPEESSGWIFRDVAGASLSP